MKSYIISENRDSFLGMKLAGIQGIYVRDTVDIERAFKGALKNPEIGIMVLHWFQNITNFNNFR